MANPFGQITNTVGSLPPGHVVLATEWNTAIGGIYTYINTTLLTAGLNVLNTVGDMYVMGASTLGRLGIGTNGQVLTSNGTNPVWGTVSNLATLTTNGDTLYYNSSANQRLPIGTNGQVLEVVSGLPAWGTPNGYVPIGGIIMYQGPIANIPSNFAICDGSSIIVAGYDGGNGVGVAFNLPNSQGVFPTGVASGAHALPAGAIGSLGINSVGGNFAHSHTIGLSSVAAGAGGAGNTSGGTGSTSVVPVYFTVSFIMRIS